jgi:hypothetical protein
LIEKPTDTVIKVNIKVITEKWGKSLVRALTMSPLKDPWMTYENGRKVFLRDRLFMGIRGDISTVSKRSQEHEHLAYFTDCSNYNSTCLTEVSFLASSIEVHWPSLIDSGFKGLCKDGNTHLVTDKNFREMSLDLEWLESSKYIEIERCAHLSDLEAKEVNGAKV